MVSLNFDLLLNFCLKKMVSIIKGSKYYLSTTNSLFYRLLNSLLDRFCVFVYRTWFHSNRRFPFCHNYSLIIRLFVKLEYEKKTHFFASALFLFSIISQIKLDFGSDVSELTVYIIYDYVYYF